MEIDKYEKAYAFKIIVFFYIDFIILLYLKLSSDCLLDKLASHVLGVLGVHHGHSTGHGLLIPYHD